MMDSTMCNYTGCSARPVQGYTCCELHQFERHEDAKLVTPGTKKADAGKVRFDLLEDGCPNALFVMAQVMTWAVEVKGYESGSWRDVEAASRRYRAALGRHRNAIARGEVYDPESKLPHWAHVACCTIFLIELEHFA